MFINNLKKSKYFEIKPFVENKKHLVKMSSSYIRLLTFELLQ